MSCCDDAPDLMPIETAIATMLNKASPIKKTHTLKLAKACGYVLAEEIYSPISVPPFANSAMDGYAVCRADLSNTDVLPLAGKSFAGLPFEGDVPKNACIRIMTGAKIPSGCDAVIMQEHTEQVSDGIRFTRLRNPDGKIGADHIKAQQNIRPIGDDMTKGALVLNKGQRLTPRDLPMLASLGIDKVCVFEKPKIAYFSTGDELIAPGNSLCEGQIYDSNRLGIGLLIEKFGAIGIDFGIISDDKTMLQQTFESASQQADLIITSGGVSVGEADHTKEILATTGTIDFWKLAIKPGKPFAFGTINDTLFCGLPGNPVSAMITLHVLAQPLVAKLSGESLWQAPQTIKAIALSDFKKRPGRTDYQRGIYRRDGANLIVDSTGNQSSGAFRSMSLANCYIVLEKERGNVSAGETVTIQPFDPSLY